MQKKIDNDYIALIGHSSNDTKVYFNLDNGTIGTVGADVTNADIQDYGNGWFRCVLTASSINRFTVLHATTNNGVTANLNTETSLWGAQLEEGSYPTSYIPTNGTAITRAAETADGSGDAATFNDSEGVLMAEISALADDSQIEAISISDGSNSNRIVMFKWNTSNTLRYRLTSSSVNVVNQSISIHSITENNKIALKYKANNFSAWINGFQLFSQSNGAVPIGLDEMQFNSDGLGNAPFYGKTREVQYFDSALTDAQLETLTSWTSLQEMITSQLYTNY